MVTKDNFGKLVKISHGKWLHEVNYDLKFEEMLSLGKLVRVGGDVVEKNFPIRIPRQCRKPESRILTFEHVLIKPKGHMSFRDMRKCIKLVDPSNPWRPARIEDILSACRYFTSEQKRRPMLCLGSIATIGDFRFGLSFIEIHNEVGRSLNIVAEENGCEQFTCALAVRQVIKV